MKLNSYFCTRKQNQTQCKYNKKFKMERRLIRISTGLRAEILGRFGCTHATLKAAMEYTTDTALSRELRRYALEHGGELWVPAAKKEGGTL